MNANTDFGVAMANAMKRRYKFFVEVTVIGDRYYRYFDDLPPAVSLVRNLAHNANLVAAGVYHADGVPLDWAAEVWAKEA